MHRRDHLPRLTIALALLALTAAGCADSETADAATDDEVVEVTLVDFAFEGLPATVEAGTTVTVSNEAEAELHELVAFRLPDDEDRSVDELAGLSPQELTTALGEPAHVQLAEPGGEPVLAVGDGTLSEPGRYAVMCFIPTGVDPQEYLRVAAETEQGPPQVEGGPPHFVHGMFTELTVE